MDEPLLPGNRRSMLAPLAQFFQRAASRESGIRDQRQPPSSPYLSDLRAAEPNKKFYVVFQIVILKFKHKTRTQNTILQR